MHLLILACSFVLGLAQQRAIPVMSAPVAPGVRLQGQVHSEFSNNQQGSFHANGVQQPQGQMNVQPLPSSQFIDGSSANMNTPLVNGQANMNTHTIGGQANVPTPLGNGHLDINGRPLVQIEQPMTQPVFVQSFPDQFEQPVAAAQVRPRPGGQPSQPQQRPLACGFSCSRESTLLMMLDGQFSSAACSDRNANPAERCSNCCGSIALAHGIETTWSAGFVSSNRADCICCINRQRC